MPSCSYEIAMIGPFWHVFGCGGTVPAERRFLISLSRSVLKRMQLDHPLPRTVRLALLILIAALPVLYVLKSWEPGLGFGKLIFFGRYFEARFLPELRACKPPVTSLMGYDGQFYCQVAMDPTLRNPNLRGALDLPAYRADRILCPVLAYLGGLGQPRLIIQAFAVLDLLFWLALFFGLAYFVRAASLRDYLCLAAAVLTSGVMFSVQRSLIDLPAATLAFYAAALSGGAGVAAMAAALLTKETYLLSLPAVVWLMPAERRPAWALARRFILAVMPLVLWYAYAHWRLGFGHRDAPNVDWPLVGLVDYVRRASSAWLLRPLHPRLIEELLAPLCMLVQVAYLVCYRRSASAYWRMGIGFAVAFLLLSPDVFVEPISFCRDAIPVTLAFNIELRRDRGRHFMAWFVTGNVGLAYGAAEMVRFLAS